MQVSQPARRHPGQPTCCWPSPKPACRRRWARGENAGRLLRHAAVVRALRPLGTVAADGTFAATVPLALGTSWKRANLRAVVLVQEQASRHVVGAASLPFGSVALR